MMSQTKYKVGDVIEVYHNVLNGKHTITRIRPEGDRISILTDRSHFMYGSQVCNSARVIERDGFKIGDQVEVLRSPYEGIRGGSVGTLDSFDSTRLDSAYVRTPAGHVRAFSLSEIRPRAPRVGDRPTDKFDRVDALWPALSVFRSPLLDLALEIPKAAEKPASGPATDDLKPRGVKRQLWLFPWDAYDEVVQWEAEYDGIEEALAGAQLCAEEIPAFCSWLFDRLDEHTGSRGKSIDLVCRVFEHGAEKYSPENWRKAADAGLVEFRREYFSAIARHLTLQDPLTPDKDSGVVHLAHAICGALMMTWHEMRAKGDTSGPAAFILPPKPSAEKLVREVKSAFESAIAVSIGDHGE